MRACVFDDGFVHGCRISAFSLQKIKSRGHSSRKKSSFPLWFFVPSFDDNPCPFFLTFLGWVCPFFQQNFLDFVRFSNRYFCDLSVFPKNGGEALVNTDAASLPHRTDRAVWKVPAPRRNPEGSRLQCAVCRRRGEQFLPIVPIQPVPCRPEDPGGW